MNGPQLAMSLGHEQEPKNPYVQLHHIIEDQGSLYSVTVGVVYGRADIKTFLQQLRKDKAYDKATHNSYAVRLSHEGVVWETKRDDGETGAGMVILRMMKKYECCNAIVVVTRWYGGVKLFGDRFRHVQDATEQGIRAALVLN